MSNKIPEEDRDEYARRVGEVSDPKPKKAEVEKAEQKPKSRWPKKRE